MKISLSFSLLMMGNYRRLLTAFTVRMNNSNFCMYHNYILLQTRNTVKNYKKIIITI